MPVLGMKWVDDLPGTFTETSWTPPADGLEFADWHDMFSLVKFKEAKKRHQLDAMRFWLADMLNYGEGTYRERHQQALDETDYTDRSLHNMARIGREVPADIRKPVEDVTFWKQGEVAGLTREYKIIVLDSAAEKKLKRDEIRDEADHYRRMGKIDPNAEQPFHVSTPPANVTHIDTKRDTCPTCNGAGTVKRGSCCYHAANTIEGLPESIKGVCLFGPGMEAGQIYYAKTRDDGSRYVEFSEEARAQ